MNPTRSANLRHDEKSKSDHNEEQNTGSFLNSRTEEERRRRREQWKLQQERERQHELLKRQKILEYEKKRAETLRYAKQKSSRHSRSRSQSRSRSRSRSQSRSSSKSPSHSWHRGRSASNISKSNTMSEKLDGSTSGAVPLFKGPEGTQISTTELRRIKVDIRRNLPAQGSLTELKRDILVPEDVIVKRRDGEGCKPIFDRAEIKKPEINVKEVEEQRTVVAIDRDQSASAKSRTSRRRSSSLSPPRNRSYSPTHLSFDQSRYRRDSKYHSTDSKTDYRDHHKIHGGNDIEKRREYKEKYERDACKRDINRSRSRERDSHSRQYMEERSYRDRYRDRSSERSHERRDRDRERNRDRDRDRDRNKSRSRERRDLTPHYIEPVHVPIYYSNFPRPIVVGPMVPVRGQVPPMGRGRHPTLMAPVRPFSPRFVPPDMYRFGPPPNPRYGPMF